jgi:hypothetical protein
MHDLILCIEFLIDGHDWTTPNGYSNPNLGRWLRIQQRTLIRSVSTRERWLEMAMGKYPPGITTTYPYPRHKITPPGHPYTHVGMDLPPYPYPCGYGSPIGSPVTTKIKHLSKYYTIQMSSISI